MTRALTEKPNAEPIPQMTSAAITLNGHYLPPPEDKDGKLWIRTRALVHAPASDLYSLWRDVTKAPLWQEQITQVTTSGVKTSHWVMGTGDQTIEWESEILADEPDQRIAWRSINGDSHNAGEVIFEAAPGARGTIVTVLQEFRMSKLTSAWETIVGRNPKQAVIENLRHFKALAETGEIPRTTGQPHGPRGTVAKVKSSVYGEKMPTPPEQKRKAS
ncbi:MAG TPA: SRPBCC family protein [Terriglobales bacterium]|nr:SRPBCC family protein [Terriglobales bacterium]